MKTISMIGCVAAIMVGIAAPASAGVNDPEVLIYRFPGVRDDGGAGNVGVSTTFHCTNFSGATELVRWVTRQSTGALLSNVTFNISHLSSVTASTHSTAAYAKQELLGTGLVVQGTTAIAATSINIICTAETIDASTAVPIGVARRGIRFSPVPGSQE
jgi:hypothetical protein